jgi:hypothetical protein
LHSKKTKNYSGYDWRGILGNDITQQQPQQLDQLNQPLQHNSFSVFASKIHSHDTPPHTLSLD